MVASFSLREEYTPHDNILNERFIICASWKELGKSSMQSVRIAKPWDDRDTCVILHKMLSEADVLIAHNGDSFDLKFVEARFIHHGLSPLPPIQSIDTLKIARNRFRFNSNRLDYLGAFLGVGRKRPTSPGLWLRVLKGDTKAIREMEQYNRQDVLLLERVFKKLQPYVPNHINRQLFGDIGCPRCGSLKTQARGVHKAITRIYQRFQCQTCGGWFRALKSDHSGTKTRVL